jgi:hypothetical protein
MKPEAPSDATHSASQPQYAFLVHELEVHTDRFNLDAEKHKRLYRLLRYWAIGLTACTTVLAAVAATNTLGPWISVVIVVFTAAAAVVTSIEGLRKPSELWIHERITHYALKDLRRELDYRCAAGLDPAVVKDCFDRLQSLLGASAENWNKKVVGPSSTNKKEGTKGE